MHYSKAYLLPGNFSHHPSLLFGLVLSADHQCQTAIVTLNFILRTNPNYHVSTKKAIYFCGLFYIDIDPDKIIEIRFKLHKYKGSIEVSG